jgi:5-hydroxyisourate hydrolase
MRRPVAATRIRRCRRRHLAAITFRTNAMGKLTTHVLDTAHGTPGHGIHVALLRRQGDAYMLVATAVTNADGRCDAPLMAGDTMVAGRYRLVFAVGAYFAAKGCALTDPPFIDEVTLDFGLADAGGDYHVPLLVSPWSYSTYRGS